MQFLVLTSPIPLLNAALKVEIRLGLHDRVNFKYNNPNDPIPHLYLYFVNNKDDLDDSRRRYPLPTSNGPFPGRRNGRKPSLSEAAINIESESEPNPLLTIWCKKNFKHPITDRLKKLESDRFHSL